MKHTETTTHEQIQQGEHDTLDVNHEATRKYENNTTKHNMKTKRRNTWKTLEQYFHENMNKHEKCYKIKL